MMRLCCLTIVLLCLQNLFGFDSCLYKLRTNFVAADACPGQDIGLVNTSIHPGKHIRWQWSFGDGRYAETFNPNISYTKGAVFRKISLKAYDSVSRCRDSIYKFIEIFPQPVSEFKSIIRYTDSCAYRLFTAYQTNPVEHAYMWFLPNGDSVYITGKNNLFIKDTLQVIHPYIALRVKSNLGCESTTKKDYHLVGIDKTFCDNINVYASDKSVYIQSQDPVQFKLYDEHGHLIQHGQTVYSKACIPVLNTGIYYVIITKEEQHIKTVKLIVY